MRAACLWTGWRGCWPRSRPRTPRWPAPPPAAGPTRSSGSGRAALKDDLARAIREEEIRKVDLWTARYRLATVEFAETETDAGALDPFFNPNRPADLEDAERFAILT